MRGSAVAVLDAGIAVAHLSKIASGKVNPTWSTVVAVADALGVTVAEIAERAASRDQRG